MKKELDDAKVKLIEAQKIEAENGDLRKALNITSKYNHFNPIFANIILRDYSNWNETFVINKGKVDGICENQTVISTEGLVGYISTVTDNTSVVSTILNPHTSVSVEISTINELALAKGDFELKEDGLMKLTHIPIGAEISVGEKVYTTGIGTVYEKGIPIGQISEVISKKNEIDRYAVITPYTNFSSLDYVAILSD